jgi:hypothetical protein
LSHQLPSSDGAKLLLSLATLPSAPNRDGDGDSARDFGPYLPVASHRSLLVLQHRWKSTAKEHLIERHGPRPAPRRAVRVQPDRPRGSGACSRRTTCKTCPTPSSTWTQSSPRRHRVQAARRGAVEQPPFDALRADLLLRLRLRRGRWRVGTCVGLPHRQQAPRVAVQVRLQPREHRATQARRRPR